MPCWKAFGAFIFLLCFAFTAVAQQAAFTADKTSGCSPLAVSFTNTSTGFSSAATYAWSFGNTNSSALLNPGTTYNNEGVYTVTLTVTDGDVTLTATTEITVYKKPVVDFSVDITKGCAPLPVAFTSHSTPGDGTISAYTWDFGDGIAQAGDGSLTHVYTIAKIISPSLTVTNSYGCYSTLAKPQLIEVLPQVTALFKADKTVLCTLQDEATFVNTSAGSGNLTYNWNFGDGATSSVPQPKHVYDKPGTYSVTLSATSPDGCTSDTTITSYLNVADFHTNIDTPLLICQNTPAIFSDFSTPAPTTENWFVDGVPVFDTASLQLQHTFDAPGNHTVQLVNVYETCPDTATKNITVKPAPDTKGFTAKLDGSCGAPVTVSFTDTSTNAVSWTWDFTSNGTATATGQTASHLYTTDGTYNVTLQTAGANGCTVKVTQPVAVHEASVDIISSEGSLGCDTKTTIFSARSEENIVEYDWNFDDGSAHSTEVKPKHTFESPGEYKVTLAYTTASGCKGKSEYTIQVYEKPKFDFTAMPDSTICGNNPVTFDVTGINIVGAYFWNFGDFDQYITVPAPYTHQYQHDSVYTVSLVIDNNGCRDTVTKENYITVLPPFPHITSAANTCDGTRGLVSFTDTSQKAQTYSWNFGDGSEPYTYNAPQTLPVQHEYKATGTYHVALTTTNGDCSVTDSVSILVLLKQNPALSAATTKFCSSDTLHTTVSDIENNPFTGSGNVGYDVTTIQYKDGSLFTGNSEVINNSGDSAFGVDLSQADVTQSMLRITTTSQYFGCADTTNYLTFQALGPVAGFSVAENSVCFKSPVVFTDQSKASHNSPIVKWEWQWGDSLSQTNKQGSSVSHLYAEPGNYQATLTVTDANNCVSSTSADSGAVIIKGPKAAFTISENPVLPATDVFFYNETNVINTNAADNRYTWNFGDGTIIKNQDFTNPVTHSFSRESTDTVTLIAINKAERCADTAFQVVTVRNPNLYFTYTTTYVNPESGCPPVIASFVNSSLNTTKVSWDFGDGNTADNLDFASHIYDKPGVYKVTLYGYFLDGSIDSVFEMVTIKGPFAVLQTVKPFACGAELITLTAASSNTKNFTWDFGDGTLLNNSDTVASHRYLTPGIYTPSLIVSDGNNCRFPFFLTKPIIIDTLHLSINKNPAVACDSSLLYFTPAIVSEAKNELGLPLTYHWRFGTGIGKDTANTENSTFIYGKPGTYEVVLSGASPYGCTDTTIETINVQPTPRALIAGPSQICENDSAVFIATATRTVTWNWQFENGNISDLQNPAAQTYTTPGVDSVSLIVNDNGCFDTAWHPLQVSAKPVINPSPLSAHLCEGDSVQLQAYDGNFYHWTPEKNISQPDSSRPYVFPDTSTKYYIEVKNEAGCVSQDSIAIAVTQRFNITSPSPIYICPGGIAQLNAYGADTYHWLNNNVSNAGIANPTTSVYSPDTYTVTGSDNFGCFTDTATVQVLTATLPTVFAGIDVTTFAGTPVQLTATGSPDIINWLWTPGDFVDCDTCAAIVVTPHTDIEYVLKATNKSGCASYDTVQVHILCKTSLVNIPSAFTPNGDGKNERFAVLGRGIREIRHFAVFDRLGEKLYETKNFTVGEAAYAGWDGTYKNKPMPPGTYVYIADLVCDTGELFRYKGTVVLIR